MELAGIEGQYYREHWTPGGPVRFPGMVMHVQAFMYLLYTRPKKPPKCGGNTAGCLTATCPICKGRPWENE